MKSLLLSLCALLTLSLSFELIAVPTPTVPDRQIAITIDDLPAAASFSMTGAAIVQMTAKLLAALQQERVPAVGFVNERKLYHKWGEVDERIGALNQWLDAGFELGNHTFGHTSLNQMGSREFEESVIQGETVTRLLMAQHGKKLRYFRHPYLDTGRDLQTRREVEAFLVSRGYRIAPVTMDAWDWNFAGVYDDAKKRDDKALQQEVVSNYLSYHTAVFNYFEKLSKDLLGYEPKQILLLHANYLEADHIRELIELLRNRGYRFIMLEEALSDGAYGLPDTYVGEEGRGWIEHWAITMGKPPRGAPVFPESIGDRAKLLPHPQP